ncbi:MAG: hypothetical protein NDJ90_00770 [Oligoflexia bacterium]|nr:hypothetical protein [Oligoflexia bacterium]
MKTLILVTFALMSTAAFAADTPAKPTPSKGWRKPAHATLPCPATVEQLTYAIENIPDCYAAVDMAEQCAAGTSADKPVVASATNVCVKQLPATISKRDKSLMDQLHRRCASRWGNDLMNASPRFFCNLNVTKFFVTLLTPDF